MFFINLHYYLFIYYIYTTLMIFFLNGCVIFQMVKENKRNYEFFYQINRVKGWFYIEMSFKKSKFKI